MAYGDTIPLVPLDVTKEIVAMEKWVGQCVVLEGEANSEHTSDSVEEALYGQWPNHDWIAHVLGNFRFLVHANKKWRREMLSNGEVTASGVFFTVTPPTGRDIDGLRTTDTRWYLIRGIPVQLQHRSTIKRLMGRWADVLQLDWYTDKLLDLRYARVELCCANFRRIPPFFEIELFRRRKRAGNVHISVAPEIDGASTDWNPGAQDIKTVSKMRKAVLKISEDNDKRRKEFAIAGGSAPMLADADVPALLKALQKRLDGGYNGTGGSEGWVHDVQKTKDVLVEFSRLLKETDEKKKKPAPEEDLLTPTRRSKRLKRSSSAENNDVPGPVVLTTEEPELMKGMGTATGTGTGTVKGSRGKLKRGSTGSDNVSGSHHKEKRGMPRKDSAGAKKGHTGGGSRGKLKEKIKTEDDSDDLPRRKLETLYETSESPTDMSQYSDGESSGDY